MDNLKNKFKKYSSRINTHYHIGMRVVKTAASVFICLVIALLTGSENVMQISGVSALVTLRATQDETIHSGLFRMLGTVIGGIFGMLTVLIGLFLPYYSQGLYVVVIPLMMVFALYVCNLFGMKDSCSMSCVVLLIVASRVNLEATVTEALYYTLFRIRDTLTGVVVATVINSLPSAQPNHDGDNTKQ